MRRLKNLLSFFLMAAVVVGLFFGTTFTSEASYTYKIKISLGNTANASFITEKVDALKTTLGANGYVVSLLKNSEEKERTLVIENLGYNDSVSLDIKELVKITATEEDTTYYVKGLKRAGSDTLEANWASAPHYVKGNETFVVAYGVDSTVPYLIQYVDEAGNKLLDDEIEYGAIGEILKIPARRIKGYKSINPKNTNQIVNFLTNSAGLKDASIITDEEGNKTVSEGATVFKFTYKKYDPTVIYNEETEYRYQYEESTVTGNQGGTTVVDRRGQNGGGQPAGNAGGGNAGGDAAGEAGGGAEPAPAPVVEPSPAPDIIDIDDEPTALAGESAKDRFVRNMIVAIVIAIVAVLAILIALIVADRKRKAQVASSNRKDDIDRE